MGNVWGQNITLSIFGESHGEGIGIVIGGLPPGEKIDENEIQYDMSRRAPGANIFTTSRTEMDQVKILSGLRKNRTTGAPLCGIIMNNDRRSADYQRNLLRPGHADYTAFVKYKGFHDHRGGGHFSGRLTAPLTFAGSIARQVLAKRGITIGAHISQIGEIKDRKLSKINKEILDEFRASFFPLVERNLEERMKSAVLLAKDHNDSVGGAVECAACGLPAGLGSPFFYSVESVVSSMMFSVPGVKGIEFGKGFGFSSMRGIDANDPIRLIEGKIVTEANHNGGISGGITNGMPVIFRVAIRPTPSIGMPQNTVDIEKMAEATIEIKGRHDPCIVLRAVPVVESCLALCILDVMQEG